MKYAILFLALFHMQARAFDVEKALDPWGNRRNARELQDKTKELRGQKDAFQARLVERQTERNTKKAKLDEQRKSIQGLKGEAMPTLFKDAAELDWLVQNQEYQVEVARKVFAAADELDQSAKDIASKMSQIRDRYQAAQVLLPLFRNSAENRALWIAVIDKTLDKPELGWQEFRELKKLRAQLAQQEANWRWQRANTLFEEFTTAIQALQASVSQKLVDNFSYHASKLAVETRTQSDLQAKILEVLVKLKTNHQAMLNAFK